MPKSKKKNIFIALLLAFYLVIIEVLLRIVFPVPEVANFNRINYSFLIHTPQKDDDFLSNAAYIWASEPDGVEFIHSLNLYGFRDRNVSINGKPGQRRMLFIGDSFVEGFMASNEKTIPNGFSQEAAKRNADIETLNLGIGASQIPQYVTLTRDAVPLFKPDYLFLIFYANDFYDIPQFDGSWFNPPFVPVKTEIIKPRIYYIIENIVANKVTPRAWHTAPFPFIAPIPDPRNPWSSKTNANHFETFVVPRIADAMKKGRFNPFVVDSYKMYKNYLRNSFDVLPHLTALNDFVGNNGSKLFIAYIPSNNQVSDAYLRFQREYSLDKNPQSLMGEQYQIQARILAKICRQLHIPFLDFTPMLRKREKAGERLYWNYDEHMKGETYLLMGTYLYSWVENQL